MVLSVLCILGALAMARDPPTNKRQVKLRRRQEEYKR